MTAKSQKQVICVNPNPSIDRRLLVDRLEVGAVQRAQESYQVAGGKGAIVARVVSNLGYEGVCVGPLGGYNGGAVESLAATEGLQCHWTRIEDETRINTTIVAQTGSGSDTIVNELGPTLDPPEWDALLDAALSLSTEAGPVCISGSLPRGITQSQARDFVTALVSAGRTVLVDSHGAGLRGMSEANPWCIKINHVEATELFGVEINTPDAAAAWIPALCDKTTGPAIITLGAQGAVFGAPGCDVTHVATPPIETVSGVGSGDAFLAGLVVASQIEQRSIEDAVRHGIAAGAANARATSQGEVSREDLSSALAMVETRPIGNGTQLR